MTSIHVDLDSIEWTPGSAYKGPDALYQGQEVFYRKHRIGDLFRRNRRRQIGRDRRYRAGTRGGGITRDPAMIVAAKPRRDPVVRVQFRRTSAIG